MCVRCDALRAEIARCRAGTPHRDRKDYYRRYYRSNRVKKIKAAKDRRTRIILEELRQERYDNTKQNTAHSIGGLPDHGISPRYPDTLDSVQVSKGAAE